MAAGHEVPASSRSRDMTDELRAFGARPLVMDGLDSAAVGQAVAQAEPDAIVHQMTALAATPTRAIFDRWFATRSTAWTSTTTTEALMHSRLAGDRHQELFELSQLAMQSIHLGRAGEAMSIGNDVIEDHNPSPRVAAVFHIRRARAWALMGTRRER